MVDTSGFQAQDLARFTPGDPSLLAGYNVKPFTEGALSGLQLAQNASQTKYLTNIEPSQQAETIAANDLNTNEKRYLSTQSPLAAIAIDKGGQLPTYDKTLAGHIDDNGDWVQTTQKTLKGPDGKEIPFGGISQATKPTNTLVKVVPNGSTGENTAITTTYVLKPDAPKGASAVQFNPETNQLEPTAYGQAVHTESAPIQHYAPAAGRSASGAALDALQKAQNLTAAGKGDQAQPYFNLYNALLNNETDAATKIKAQIGSIENNDVLKTAGKDPVALNLFTQQTLAKNVDDLKKSGASPETIQEAQSYLDTAKQRGVQLQQAAQAQIGNAQAKTNQANSAAGANDNKAAVQDAKNQTDVLKRQLDSLKDQADLNTKLAAITEDKPTKAFYLGQAQKINDQIQSLHAPLAQVQARQTQLQAAQAPNAATSATANQLPVVSSDADYNAIKPGQQYTAPDGKVYTKGNQ